MTQVYNFINLILKWVYVFLRSPFVIILKVTTLLLHMYEIWSNTESKFYSIHSRRRSGNRVCFVETVVLFLTLIVSKLCMLLSSYNLSEMKYFKQTTKTFNDIDNKIQFCIFHNAISKMQLFSHSRYMQTGCNLFKHQIINLSFWLFTVYASF